MPDVQYYDDALLTALRLDDAEGTASGALYTAAGTLVPASQRDVPRSDPWRVADPPAISRPAAVIGKYRLDGYELHLDEAVLVGHALAGWGHVITETLSTAWAAPGAPDVPVVVVPWGRLWVSALPRLRDVLALAGWGRRPLVVTSGDVVLGRVHVPERLVHLDQVMHEAAPVDPAMNDVYDRVAQRCRQASARSQRVFLARPDGHRRAHPHEAEVEQLLMADGFVRVRGWELPVAEQVALVDGASCLVGFSGSNLHNSVFARRTVPVVELRDQRAHDDADSGQRRLQSPLCALRSQPFSAVDGFRDGRPRPAVDMVRDALARLSASSR